jgi:thioredoxin-related protein
MCINSIRVCCNFRNGLLCIMFSAIGCNVSNVPTAKESSSDSTTVAAPTLSSSASSGTTVANDAPMEAAVDVSSSKFSNSVPAKAIREPIYIEEANGKELIAAALKIAQRDHKHVLVEWGGNWCGWCYKLHDVFHNDPEVQPIIHEEFVLVLVDSGPNKDLMLEYGGKDRQYSYPHLTVLNEHGSVLTNQETGSLEEGPKHDPKLVSAFLHKWMPQKLDAEKVIAEACATAAKEDKRVLVRVGTPYCGWCTVLAQFVQDHSELFGIDYIDVKIDTQRMLNSDSALARFETKKSGGVPWMVILDSNGKELASSFGPEGNIGYPYQPNEIKQFIAMLRDSRQRSTDDDLAKLEADLNAYRENREKRLSTR